MIKQKKDRLNRRRTVTNAPIDLHIINEISLEESEKQRNESP